MLKTILAYKKQIIHLFWLIYAVILAGVIYTTTVDDLTFKWREYGILAGKLSLVTVSIALIPGIVRRFRAQKYMGGIDTLIMAFRRQFGLLAFVLALSHYLLMKVFPTFKYLEGKFSVQTFEIFGMLAFTIFMLLAVTSNNFFIRKLKANWGKVHNFAHVAIWLIAIHVFLINPSSPSAAIVAVICALDIASFAYKYSKLKTN